MQHPNYRKNALILSILLGIVFILCLIFIWFFPSYEKGGNLTAFVYQDGKLLHTIHLGLVTDPYEITVTDDTGNYNVIQVCPGSIGIIEASCPDKLCVHMGFRESSLLPITCLPNNLVIRFESEDTSPDAISASLMLPFTVSYSSHESKDMRNP